MVSHRPGQSKAETRVESQPRQWLAAAPGQFASSSWDLASWSGKWEESRPGLQVGDWLGCCVWKCLSHTSWQYFLPLLVLKSLSSCICPLCLKDQYDIWCFKNLSIDSAAVLLWLFRNNCKCSNKYISSSLQHLRIHAVQPADLCFPPYC